MTNLVFKYYHIRSYSPLYFPDLRSYNFFESKQSRLRAEIY